MENALKTSERSIELIQDLKSEMGKVIEGQDEVIESLLVAVIAKGHVLLEGVPGVAKTLMAQCLASCLQVNFSRVQFTPDLMPADITGVNIFDINQAKFHFQPGPIFSDIVLADEINRAPAKTQSALLEAMQERQVTIDGETRTLPEHFMVIATQNPLEYEGTFPLPEAQLDRFLMKILVNYPNKDEEQKMVKQFHNLREMSLNPSKVIQPIIKADDLLFLKKNIFDTAADQSVINYTVELVRQSRELESLTLGASPRASFFLLHAAKTLAYLRGKSYVTPDEIQKMALPVLRHRIILTPEAEIEGLTPDGCIEALIKKVAIPR